MRQTIEALEIEDKKRNELIKRALDRMIQSQNYGPEAKIPFDAKEHRKKTAKLIGKEDLTSSIFFGIVLILIGIAITVFGLWQSELTFFAYLLGALIIVLGSWSIISGVRHWAYIQQKA